MVEPDAGGESMPLYGDKAFARAIATIIADSNSIEEIKEKFLRLYDEDAVIVKMLSKKEDTPE